MRRTLIGATMVLVAGTTAACGGGIPEDAPRADFCKAIIDLPSDKPNQDDIDGYAEKLEETGTPKGLSEKGRKGFEKWVEFVGDVDADDSDKELQKKFQDEIEKDGDFEALFDYVGKECVPAQG